MSRRHLFLVIPVLFLASACGNPPPQDMGLLSEIDPLFDPQLLTLDPRTPTSRFDGGFGSILLGPGWAPTEQRQEAGEEIHFAWVRDHSAAILFERPGLWPLDFWGHCRPFDYDGAPPQSLSLQFGEDVVAKAEMPQGWSEVRLPLPDSLPARGLHRLVLQFEHATRPSEVIEGQTDDRRLSAACQTLAIVPRDLEDVPGFLAATTLRAEDRQLVVPLGGAVEWPLAPRSRTLFRLGEVKGSCPGCEIQVQWIGARKQNVLWQGSLEEAADLETTVEAGGGTFGRLRLALVNDQGTFDPSRLATIGLPEGFLTWERAEEAKRRPDVFVYLIDTLRADMLEADGPNAELSPEVAEFARSAVTYRETWSASAWTLPSVVSILTGVYPQRHGVMQGNVRLSNELGIPPMASRLREHGYETLGLSQSLVATGRFGINTGFQRFFFSDQLNGRSLRSQELRRALLLHLHHRHKKGAPLFVYMHSVDPHSPYEPRGKDRRFAEAAPGNLPKNRYLPYLFMQGEAGQDPQEVAHLRALYRGEVAFADRQFGRFVALLRHLDLFERSLIVLLSDHGEEFGEHDGFDHGRTLYEEMLRVPMLIKYPGGRWAGTTVEQRVSTVDLLPTVLAEAGIDASNLLLDGGLLYPPEVESRPRSRQLIFSEVAPARSKHAEAVNYRALALGDLKCLESRSGNDQFGREVPPLRVFDLGQDPGEQNPLTDEASLEKCRRLFEQWQIRSDLLPDSTEAGPATDPDTLEKLRALGYID